MATQQLTIRCTRCNAAATPGEHKGDDVRRCDCDEIKLRRFQS